MKKLWLVPVVGVLIAVPVFAGLSGRTKATDALTLGDFAMKVAVALGSDASTEKDAMASLRAAGVRLDADLGARLTEGMAARVLADLGLQVVPPRNPDGPVSAGVADSLATRVALTSVSRTDAAAGSSLLPPLSCLHSQTSSLCVTCCMNAGFNKKICSLFCKLNQPPPPSGSEPQY